MKSRLLIPRYTSKIEKPYSRIYEEGPVTVSTSIPKNLRPEIPYKGDDSGNETDSEEVKRFKKLLKKQKNSK